MPQTIKREDHLLHRYDLSGIPTLDVSSPRNRLLAERDASEVRGVDIVFYNHLRPDRGRRPIGVVLNPTAPLTTVESMDADSLVLTQKFYRVNDSRFFFANSVDDLTSFTYTTGSGVCTQGTGTPFAGYMVRDNDYLLVQASDDNGDFPPGVYKISATNGTTTITIAAGISSADRTLTAAIVAQEKNVIYDTELTVGADSFGALVKSKPLYDEEGPWPDALEGTFITLNADNRMGGVTRLEVLSVGTYAQPGDTLFIDPEAVASSFTNYKLAVSYLQRPQRTGIWVSDGRKFWLLRGGSYLLVFDLGSDDYLGLKWRMTPIASNRMMIVNEMYPPRIIRFDRSVIEAGNESLAGCIAPRKQTESLVSGAVKNASWLMDAGAGGSLTAGSNLAVVVRGVNYADSLASSPVQVVARSGTADDDPPYAGTDNLTLTVTANQKVSVFTSEREDDFNLASPSLGDEEAGFAPPIHSRITHIEIWRTQTAGGAYYLESTIELSDLEGNEKRTATTDVLVNRAPSNLFPVRLSDTDVLGLPILTNQDRQAGGLPPICRDVVSLEGTTLCFGRAHADSLDPTLDARNFYDTWSYTTATGVMTASTGLDKYKFRDGDQFVVIDGGYSSGVRVPPGAYDITAANPAADKVTIDLNLSSSDVSTIKGYILRPYTIDWPRIESDEEVWYSRTDQFAPEGFPPRVLRLSQNGDRFHRAVVIGNYVAVIMRDAVHILFKDGINLLKNTVEEKGAGTPWPDSVITHGERVYWATNKGINVLSTTPDADDTGRRARVISFGRQFEDWFKEALLNSETIDAGIDVRYGLLRFRRKKADHTYETLQYRLPQGQNDPGQWTFLDNDNGVRYANSTLAEAVMRDTSALYSIDPITGAAFDCIVEDTDPYTDLVTQDDLVNYTVTTTSIEHSGGVVFDPKMVGDIIEFSHGYKRTILTASDRKLTFDSVPIDLEASFTVSPVPYRVRSGSMRGQLPQTLKTLVASTIRLLPGQRDSTGPVTLRVFQNFSDTPASEDEISIFTDTDSGRDSEGRVSSIQAAGIGIELEIEALGRNDFEIDSIDVIVREEMSDRVSEVFSDG